MPRNLHGGSEVIDMALLSVIRRWHLPPFADRLSAWLKTESKRGRKRKHTLKQLHADLVNLGYEGSYNRVAAFAREWRR